MEETRRGNQKIRKSRPSNCESPFQFLTNAEKMTRKTFGFWSGENKGCPPGAKWAGSGIKPNRSKLEKKGCNMKGGGEDRCGGPFRKGRCKKSAFGGCEPTSLLNIGNSRERLPHQARNTRQMTGGKKGPGSLAVPQPRQWQETEGTSKRVWGSTGGSGGDLL